MTTKIEQDMMAPLGIFSGTIIPDNSDLTQAFQLMETAIEERQGYVLNTRQYAVTTTIPLPIQVITTHGYSSSQDGGGGSYRRVSSEPTHPGKIQSLDGA